MVPELAIQAGEPVETRVRKLAAGVSEAQKEISRVQLELNLQIAELQLKVQPSTLLEVTEKRGSTITIGIGEISSAVKGYTKLFEELFKVLTTL